MSAAPCYWIMKSNETAQISVESLRHCTICPRACGADRLAGVRGSCGVTGAAALVAHYMLHRWEEPCISGPGGAGTVFFGGCGLRCIFCQNRAINGDAIGDYYDTPALASLFLKLQSHGADNIDLVTPTHYAPQIIEAVAKARSDGLAIPVIWNSSGYENVDVVRALRGTVDIYMPDFKYSSDELARRFSAAPDYFEIASRAIAEMAAQTGDPVFDGRGMLLRGTIIRILVLPGHTLDAMKTIRYLHRTYGDSIILSIMGQYTPPAEIVYDELRRPLTQEEYDEVTEFAADIGVTRAYIQELGSVGESFIPKFGFRSEQPG